MAKPKLRDPLLTAPQRELLDAMHERDMCGLSVRFVGCQVAGCHVNDPKGYGGIAADEIETLDDWSFPYRLVPPLLKYGFIESRRRGVCTWTRGWWT